MSGITPLAPSTSYTQVISNSDFGIMANNPVNAFSNVTLEGAAGPQPGPNPFTVRGLTLASIDCPQELKIGTGEQKMVVTETVGGGLSVLTTGFFPDVNTWSGVLHQPNVKRNAAIMQGWMVDGKEGLVTWNGQQYYGIVKKFTPTWKKGGNICAWQLDVQITRAANGAFTAGQTAPSADDQIATHFDTINTANQTIQDAFPLPADGSTPSFAQSAASSFNTSLNTAANAVAAATPTAVASATTLQAAQSAVSATQDTVPTMTSAFPSGSLPAISAEQITSSLAVVSALLSTSQTQATATLQGADLYDEAATKYGDLSHAYAIMAAGGFASPYLPGSRATPVSYPPIAGVFNDGNAITNTGIVP